MVIGFCRGYTSAGDSWDALGPSGRRWERAGLRGSAGIEIRGAFPGTHQPAPLSVLSEQRSSVDQEKSTRQSSGPSIGGERPVVRCAALMGLSVFQGGGPYWRTTALASPRCARRLCFAGHKPFETEVLISLNSDKFRGDAPPPAALFVLCCASQLPAAGQVIYRRSLDDQRRSYGKRCAFSGPRATPGYQNGGCQGDAAVSQALRPVPAEHQGLAERYCETLHVPSPWPAADVVQEAVLPAGGVRTKEVDLQGERSPPSQEGGHLRNDRSGSIDQLPESGRRLGSPGSTTYRAGAASGLGMGAML